MAKPWLVLIAFTMAAHWQVFSHDFVNYDDPHVIHENPHVRTGLTSSNVVWAFTQFYFGNWMPLTWITYQMDVSLYGLNPAGFHATNLIFHLGGVLALFSWLNTMTGSTERSLVVAILFAVHPLHVESVAWIAERKGIVSTFFGMLALVAYAWYRKKPNVGRYLTVAGLFFASLMAKQMLVTLPAALLLLDYWPLLRFNIVPGENRSATARRWAWPIVEKLPLFLLAAVYSITAYIAQKSGDAISGMEKLPLVFRLRQSVVTYGETIRQALAPIDLGVEYPLHEEQYTPAMVIPRLGILVGVTFLLLFRAGQRRYLLVGWLWFLGILFPVSGVIPIGSHARADRYTDVPLIGLFIASVWFLADVLQDRPRLRNGICITFVIAYTLLANWQQRVWNNSILLHRHNIAVTTENPISHCNLATALALRGDVDEAIAHYREAFEYYPEYVDAIRGLGLLLIDRQNLAEASELFRKASQLRPNDALSFYHLGLVAMCQDNLESAENSYREAITREPNHVDANNGLGLVHWRKGDLLLAKQQFEKAIALNPEMGIAYANLGEVLEQQGKIAEAASVYSRALSRPKWRRSALRLGWIRATAKDKELRDAKEALMLARQLAETPGGDELDVTALLAASLAANDEFDLAVSVAEKGIALAEQHGLESWKSRFRANVERFRGRQYADPQ